jgi:hypothetical protein
MRKLNLTKEEKEIFKNTKIKEEDIQDLMKKYVVKKINNVYYVLCDGKRDGAENADFMDTGLALTGILKKGETLHDFVEFRLRMRQVLEYRNRDFVIEQIKRKVKRIREINL